MCGVGCKESWWTGGVTQSLRLLNYGDMRKWQKKKQTRACGETEQRNMGWGTYLTALYFFVELW